MRPGTIEEEEEELAAYSEGRFFAGVDSPLLARGPQAYILPAAATPGPDGLFRVNTCNSSLTIYAGRQDSCK